MASLRRTTLYQQLLDILVGEIESGKLAAGGPLPTEAQLGQTYGVSRVTVRRVIHELAERGLVQRERGRAAFVRAQAQARAEAPHLVAFVLSDLRSATWLEVLAGVEAVLRPAGYDVLVMNSDDESAKERTILERLATLPLAGAILRPCGESANTPRLAAARAAGLPIVMLDRYDPAIACDRVEMENERASRQLVGRLVDLGHRRIGCVHWPGPACTVVRSRRRGYEAALAAAGLPIDEALVRTLSRSRGRGVAYEVDRLLVLDDPPTAIFGFNEHIATAVLQRLRERGVGVPEEVSVVGFGDSPAAAMLAVPLTTVRWSKAGLGEIAARMLLDRLSAPGAPPRQEVLPCRLVLRASSAPPMTGWSGGSAAAS